MSRSTPASLLLVLLPLLLGLDPAAVAAQDFGSLRRQAEACLASRVGPPCKAMLDASHRLKQAAEKQEQWRCYSALLAVEAVLITYNLGGNSSVEVDRAFAEASDSCQLAAR